jgi:hypothetical protein
MAIIGVNQTLLEENRKHEERVRADNRRLAGYPNTTLNERAYQDQVRRAAESRSGVINMSADRWYQDPVGEFDRRVKEHRRLNPRADEGEAAKHVAGADPVLAEQRRVAITPLVGRDGVVLPSQHVAPPQTGQSAIVQFDALVTDHRARTGVDYGTAMAEMARQHPDLAERRRREYAGTVSL